MDNKIIEKIKKLLSLSESSNSNEAEVAMLKAQELLAKHKLSLKEVQEYKVVNSKIETKRTNITFTTAKWKGELAGLIADNFGCYCYFKTRGTNSVVFLGREEDVTVSNIVIDYALDFIESVTNRIKYSYKRDGLSTRGVVNDYAMGFIEGLRDKFDQQKSKNQEWGLVLVKDKEVTEKYENIKFNRTLNTDSTFKGNSDAYECGVKDGESFSISDKISEEKSEDRILLQG